MAIKSLPPLATVKRLLTVDEQGQLIWTGSIRGSSDTHNIGKAAGYTDAGGRCVVTVAGSKFNARRLLHYLQTGEDLSTNQLSKLQQSNG